MRPLSRNLLFSGRRRRIDAQKRLYDRLDDPAEIATRQLHKFNSVWRYCTSRVPFYASWSNEHRLPAQIDSLDELAQFPPLTKDVMADRFDEIFEGGAITRAYSTGGTTGTPTKYPRGRGEADYLYANTYLARSWSGISPFDRHVHIWGHSHLFGASGLAGRITRAKRQAADRLVNATRLDAYDLTAAGLAHNYESLIGCNPKYIIGYSSALFQLASHIDFNGLSVAPLTELQTIVATAETLTPPEAAFIEQTFRCEVAVEYGAAETGVVAASRGSTWPLQVLWDSFIVQTPRSDSVFLTTLDDRLFPLVNYAIGDRVRIDSRQTASSILEFDAVLGRDKDVVQVGSDGEEVLVLSAILPVHILKSIRNIRAVQFRQEGARLRIFLHSSAHLDLDHVMTVLARGIRSDHPSFDPRSVILEEVDRPILTRAGKHALFVP